MYKVLVACLENWDTLMELLFVLKKGGCTVDVFCSKDSWLLKNQYYNNWIESPSDVDQYQQQLLQISLDKDADYHWVILGDEKLLKIISEHPGLSNNELCEKILPVYDIKNKPIMGSKYGLCLL